MSTRRYNVSNTVSNKLCTGCGVCEDVCPVHAIKMVCQKDINEPVIDDHLCLGEKCGRCVGVCPGVGCDLKKTSSLLFSKDDDEKRDSHAGYYQSAHVGYSMDYDIRYHSASGGVLSQMLIFLLDKKYVDGVVVTAYKEDHITPYSYIASTREEVLNARSSKYCPVSLCGVGNEMVKRGGRYVIVGLPCHIQGFRKREQKDKKFSDCVWGYFSIYCSCNRSFAMRDFLFDEYGVDKSTISSFSFRDNGCLGNMEIETREDEKTNHWTIPYVRYYGATRSFFKPHRCLTCIDHYGELADVCFGDIHIKPYSEDKIGINSWIIRSHRFKSIFEEAKEEGYIAMDEVSIDIVNQSQKKMLFPKKRRAKVAMTMDRMVGRMTPCYDESMPKALLKDYLSVAICHVQRFMGRHQLFKPVVKYLYNKKR